MATVYLKTGEVLQGDVVSVGEPHLAVLHSDQVVELEAVQIERIEGTEPGLVLPAGLPRAGHYRRFFIDAEPNGDATMHHNCRWIGTDEHGVTDACATGEPGVGDEPPRETWEIRFGGGKRMEVRYLDAFGFELPVTRDCEQSLVTPRGEFPGAAYTVHLEVPILPEWPQQYEGIILMTIREWAERQEDGTWRFHECQFAGGGVEIIEMLMRLPLGARVLSTSPPARWFRDRGGRPVCRWKACLFAESVFEYDVRYRLPE